MNCCRGERAVGARPKGKYDDFFLDISDQIPNTIYVALYDRLNTSLVADKDFNECKDERFTDKEPYIRCNVEQLITLLHRAKDIGGSNEATEPSVLLLTTSIGYVFCVLSVTTQHSLIVMTLLDPSDACEITGAIFELRLRNILAKIGAAIAN